MGQMIGSNSNGDNLKVEQRFLKIFSPLPYKHGTYYDARKVYKQVPQDVQQRFSNKGRTPEGQWSEMVTWWNVNVKKAKKLKTSTRTSTGGM